MKYLDAVNTLAGRDSRKLTHNTYLQRRSPKSIAVKLHNTDVLTFSPGRTVYNSGGWRTVTTKDRMNRYGPKRVYSDSGVWYLVPLTPFADGVTVWDSGRITHAGPVPKKTLAKRAKIRAYAGRFIEELRAGEIRAPGPGDCWGCFMRTVDGHHPAFGISCVAQHVRENYYVPSLLANACRAGRISHAAGQYLASFWDSSAPADQVESMRKLWGDFGTGQIRKALIRYLYRHVGV